MKNITNSKFYKDNFSIEIDNDEFYYFQIPGRNFYAEEEWIEMIEEKVGDVIDWEYGSNSLLVNIENYYGLDCEEDDNGIFGYENF